MAFMKIVRLTPVDARTWRQNHLVLVDKEGKLIRPLTSGETKVLADLTRKAKHTRRVSSFELVENGGKSKLTVTPSVMQRTVLVEQQIDDGVVMTGRDYFTSQVLAQYGECQLRTLTGQIIKTVRDPNLVRPKSNGVSTRAPHPDVCQCKPWGEAHPGRHHKICEWNLQAPIDQQAIIDEETLPILEHKPVGRSVLDPKGVATKVVTSAKLPAAAPAPRGASILSGLDSESTALRAKMLGKSAEAQSPMQEGLFSPEECPNKCLAWAKTQGSVDGEHHPICQYKESWEASRVSSGNGPMFLMSLSSGEVSRAATADEITEAAEKGYIIIGDEQFAVVPEAEAKAKAKKTA